AKNRRGPWCEINGSSASIRFRFDHTGTFAQVVSNSERLLIRRSKQYWRLLPRLLWLWYVRRSPEGFRRWVPWRPQRVGSSCLLASSRSRSRSDLPPDSLHCNVGLYVRAGRSPLANGPAPNNGPTSGGLDLLEQAGMKLAEASKLAVDGEAR